ncbi:MAG: ABC transporter substrate-binding protein [Candidatus Sulfotelmatobacter sp.]
MHQRLRTIVPPLLLILLLVAIAGAVHTYASPPGGLQLPVLETEDGDARVRIGKFQYPREAVDSDEVRVSIARPAHRVVSQYWSIDEFVYSILPPQDVVAVSQSAYAEEISNVLQNVQTFKPAVATDVERVVALDPDLMFISREGRADYTSLARSSGVPVYRIETSFETLDQIEQNIRLVGYMTGQDEAAAKEASRFHEAIEKAVSMRPPGSARPRILALGGRYSYGKKTLFQDIVTKLGGINVGAENGLVGYDSVNFEQIVRWDPEWIIAGAKTGNTKQVLATLMSDPAISLTQAARNGHIVVVDNRVFLPMSPYTSIFVQAIADAIYGRERTGEQP